MSVLNQSGEEQQECPLCMEPLEVDDLNFYPCTCGYQICRFCWHRIRTDENGLCPACRKAYSENPADFIPLSQEQVAKLKAEKRARDQQKKAKLSESRKHLASVRVVQRNLVFVVGLPVRLADAEVLRRHEYFGKFGKIHKVVINQSTSYAGSQGPSASAYVTYMKSDDALRAIQSVNNITLDGRQIKSSLGTTKYCSHFMKNQACPKPDCMYLHDFGDPEASFTKEQMHAGKHQEYEKKLHEALLARTINNTQPTDSKTSTQLVNSKGNSKEITTSSGSGGTTTNSSPNSSSSSNSTNKENWPQLNLEKDNKKDKDKTKKSKTKATDKSKEKKEVVNKLDNSDFSKSPSQDSDHSSSPEIPNTPPQIQTISSSKLPPHLLDDNSSFFSSNPFQKVQSDPHSHLPHEPEDEEHSSPILSDVLPSINTSENWAAAFGFAEEPSQKPFMHGTNGFNKDLDLTYNGFLFDMIQKSNGFTQPPPQQAQPPQLDQNMSKFFMDFHKNNKDPGFPPNNLYQADRIMMLQQNQLEEQFLSLNKPFGNGYQNGTSHYLNEFGGYNKQPAPQQQQHRSIEDELDFDPIQETQKAFAELMASEQNHKTQNGNRMVGHGQNGGYLPPPPPGFVQPSNTHMNSFGSKILPFLNMSNSSSQLPNGSTQNGWPPHHQQPQHHKNVSNTCNDWKVLDPAILSSSRHYPLAANMPPLRDHYTSLQQGAPPQNGQMRNYDFANSAFSNFAQQLPFNSYSQHINSPQNMNWFGSEINTNISSPPGFRNQTTKQQEC